jgi:hypothetical protein
MIAGVDQRMLGLLPPSLCHVEANNSLLSVLRGQEGSERVHLRWIASGINAGTLSRDGALLATGTLDGRIRF